MKILRKTITAAAAGATLLAVSASAMAAPPGKADYNVDPAAENAARYGSGEPGYGYSYGYVNPYAAYGSPGTRYYAPTYYEAEPGYAHGPSPYRSW
jgi:hypothetical protein